MVIKVQNEGVVTIAMGNHMILALEKFGPSVLEHAKKTIMLSGPVRSGIETTCAIIQTPDRPALTVS